ncbi:uncharacterized protein LOC118422468 isoform X2 [Branchiostoma floridae]|uniref:Uncharacterized protein LOC118422468 isoform X2 n=1 Tax=Branchiostoma floridae TaxID=7739 RepID=A0A9J7MZN3_BRAFL|nr:uncharacterized protein LOC118422468 isoform X2 [Branchiostoma floridae]
MSYIRDFLSYNACVVTTARVQHFGAKFTRMASPAAKRMTFSSEVLFAGALPTGSPSLYDSEPLILPSDVSGYQLPSHWYKQPDLCTEEDYQMLSQSSKQEDRTNQKQTEMEGNKQAAEEEVQILEVELEEKPQQICAEHEEENCSQGEVPQESTGSCLNYQDMQVGGYEDTNTVQCGLTNTDNYSQDCSIEDEQLLPEAETLRQLDGVLREQMNEEIEQFRSNLHGLLTDHYLRHRYFLNSGNISSDMPYGPQSTAPMNDSLCSSGSEACATSESLTSDNENRYGMDIPATVPDRGQEEHMKQQYLISMLTSASVITNALRKKEFSV